MVSIIRSPEISDQKRKLSTRHARLAASGVAKGASGEGAQSGPEAVLFSPAPSHTQETIKELRADRRFAVEYLKAALAELDDPDNRAAGFLALRDVAEAYAIP